MTHSTTPTTKNCTKCDETKPATVEYFYRDKSRRDKLTPWCKACLRAYQVSNVKRLTEYKHAYYVANAEEAAEQGRVYREANKERIAERDRAYRVANVEKRAEHMRAYRAKNKERIAEHNRNRRSRKLNAEGDHTAADIRAQYKAQRGRCYYAACGHSKLGDAYHVDHIVPLSRGGSNDISNLVISCPTCNLQKGDKLPSEWPQGGRLL